MAALNKTAKTTRITADYHFQPIAVESLGPANESAVHFLVALEKKTAQLQTCNERETAFSFQCLSVLVQCYFTTLLLLMTARIKCHSLHFQILIFVSKSLGKRRYST